MIGISLSPWIILQPDPSVYCTIPISIAYFDCATTCNGTHSITSIEIRTSNRISRNWFPYVAQSTPHPPPVRNIHTKKCGANRLSCWRLWTAWTQINVTPHRYGSVPDGHRKPYGVTVPLNLAFRNCPDFQQRIKAKTLSKSCCYGCSGVKLWKIIEKRLPFSKKMLCESFSSLLHPAAILQCRRHKPLMSFA